MTHNAVEITLIVEVDSVRPIPQQRLEAAVRWLLAREGVSTNTGLSIVLTDDEAVRTLNRQYRGVDRPTDVLSFPAETMGLPGEDDYLGDLVIALPYLERQAAAESHSVDDELLLAVIHGTLHLLGYDHDTPANQEAMWAIQAEALAAAQVQIAVPRFSFDEGQDDEPEGGLGRFDPGSEVD